MPYPPDHEILQYLGQPDNFRFAIEISRYTADLRRDFWKAFWKGLHLAIVKTRPAARPADEFKFQEPSEVEGKWVTLRAIPREATSQPRNLAITIEQSREDE